MSFDSELSYSVSGNLGIQLEVGNIMTILYSPNKEDEIFDKILYAKLIAIEVNG